MERKIGETFSYKGKTYQAFSSYDGCKGCAFNKGTICLTEPLNELTGNCRSIPSALSIVFKEVKNMDIRDNKLTINIPEGMEIDIENSDLKAGVIKFKKKEIDYIDVCISLNSEAKLLSVTYTNCKKVIAISQLMDIADYYNSDWKPNWSKQSEHKYYILYDNNNGTYTVDYNGSYVSNNIYFKCKEDAQEVINNPNFREILDAIYKN